MIPFQQNIASVGEDVKRLKLSCTAGGIVKQYSHCGKQFDNSLKN